MIILRRLLVNGYSSLFCNVAPNRKKQYSIKNMSKVIKTACFLGAAFLLAGIIPQGIFPQEAAENNVLQARTIPDALRRPQRGEMPRYPQDFVIGELGRGQASEEAYRFARNLLAALAAGNSAAPVFALTPPALIGSHIEELRGIEPRTFRLGGGRAEVDGNVSFLVRFVGREESITGELFIRLQAPPENGSPPEEPGRWLLDELILEERRTLTDIRDSYRFVFSPYERFF